MQKKIQKNIVLTGMMGSGKSTIAKALGAAIKGFEIIDTDSVIEKKQNAKISDIFKEHGEIFFRGLENKIIEEISNSHNSIISVGGGAFENTTNIEALKQNGIIFYLNAPAQELYKRVQGDINRPMLTVENPKEEFTKLLEKRTANYNLADYTIEISNKTTEEITNEIIEKYLKNEKNYS